MGVLDIKIDRGFEKETADEGGIVMVKGEEIHESIGCSFDEREGVIEFFNWLIEDFDRLDEFMPDTDYTKVTEIYIKGMFS